MSQFTGNIDVDALYVEALMLYTKAKDAHKDAKDRSGSVFPRDRKNFMETFEVDLKQAEDAANKAYATLCKTLHFTV